jgi:hypothetical protein
MKNSKMTIENNAVLIADSHHGIYIPQIVVKSELHNPNWDFEQCSIDDIKSILNGPDDKLYWDAWNNIEQSVKITDNEGTVYFLYQNDDLWAIPEQCAEQIENWMI